MGMMGKIKEAQQKAEDTKKRLENVYIDEKSSDGLIEVTVSVAGHVKKVDFKDELLEDKEQLEDYLILTLNKALSRAKTTYDQELAAVAKEGMPDIPGLAAHGLDIDTYDEAERLDWHLKTLSHRAPADGRDTVLVIGAEKLSSIVDWEDRNTCILFGDGAGAAVLQNRENTHGLLTACMGADGRKASILSQPGGGCLHPATSQSVSDRLHFLKMDGKEVFKSAVTAMTPAAREALARCELEIDRIKCIIPHQANMRILKAVGDRLGASEDQVFSNLEHYGNTSAASVAIALDEAVEQGKVERGDLILLLVFGAGLTWGAAIIEW